MTDVSSPVVLEFINGPRAGEKVSLTLPCVIGRGAESTIQVTRGDLGTEHGRFHMEGGVLCYTDTGSTNGSLHRRGDVFTPLGGRERSAELWNDDVLELGDPAGPVKLVVQVPEVPLTGIIASRSVDDVDQLTSRVASEASQLNVLFTYASQLNGAQDLTQVFRSGGLMIFDLVPGATHVTVALNQGAGRFPVAVCLGRSGGELEGAISRTLMSKVVSERTSLLLANAPDELAGARSVVAAGLASTLCVPLWIEDRVFGVLQVDNRDKPGVFTGRDLEAVTVAARQISLAAENASLMEKVLAAEERLKGENSYLKREERGVSETGLIGESTAMLSVVEEIAKVRDTRVPVLVRGETGTGKELVARALHYTSRRAEHLFVAQNCSALPDNLLESELFGHTKGAFTGADRDKKGLFELADGGTIFLDELGEMPANLQAKLLRVLQEGEIWPIGASGPRKVDVRVVSATHRDLDEMVHEGSFRQDLYYRLNVFPILLPSLRERRSDIPLLAQHFLSIYAGEFGCELKGFSDDALAHLKAYDWPGNVRELQNEIQRVLIQRPDQIAQPSDLSARVRGLRSSSEELNIKGGSLKEMMDNVERIFLARALAESENNKTQAAKALGITREGLHKKLARQGMT